MNVFTLSLFCKIPKKEQYPIGPQEIDIRIAWQDAKKTAVKCLSSDKAGCDRVPIMPQRV